MPIDWPEHKVELQEVIDRLYEAMLSRKAPLSQQVSQIPIHEGNRAQMQYPNDAIEDIELKEYQATVRFTDADLQSQGHNIVFDALDTLTNQMAEQVERSILDEAANLPPELGGTITGNAPERVMEQILAILDDMIIDFDEFGNPTLPAIVLNPRDVPGLTALEDSPKYRDRFESIMKRKHLEWRAREGNRRLAD